MAATPPQYPPSAIPAQVKAPLFPVILRRRARPRPYRRRHRLRCSRSSCGVAVPVPGHAGAGGSSPLFPVILRRRRARSPAIPAQAESSLFPVILRRHRASPRPYRRRRRLRCSRSSYGVAASGARVVPTQPAHAASPATSGMPSAQVAPLAGEWTCPYPGLIRKCPAAQQQMHGVPGFVHAAAVPALSKPRPLCRQPETGF